ASGRDYAEARPLKLDRGTYVFQSQCATCHTLGQGDKVGPDLAGVSARRERAWLVRYVTQPDKVLAEGDPIPTALNAKYRKIPMPNPGLDSQSVTAVLKYIETQGAAGRDHGARGHASAPAK